MEEASLVTTALNADGAEGVNISHWYIAIVGNRTEKKIGGLLSELGFETYVAIQRTMRIWKNGTRKYVDRVVFPSLVFIKATEEERRTRIIKLPFINRFMCDPARRPGPHFPSPAAIVPDKQIETLQFMLEHSQAPVYFDSYEIKTGDRVRVIDGDLVGLEGVVHRTTDGKNKLFVSLDILGCASVEIDRNLLKLI